MADSTGTVTLWCTLIPNPGKEKQVRFQTPSTSSMFLMKIQLRDALLNLAETVKKVETECIQYQVIESEHVPDGPSSTVVFNLLEQ